ncbi:MAG: PD-(D/E)XK nuclease family protein [Bacteroidales bacterium]|nr:PD-(D/E)XK nuclease family protein [Bacteroidales bacterium]MDZ4203717.1 PD-(D/E)XK nuclease family protein [Bacteroidales bacterium]
MNTLHQPFLDRVAGHLLKYHQGRMHQVCVVLPNRRAGTFLKKYLSSHIEAPALAPAIFAIEDFVFELSGLHLADHLLLSWELYTEYKLLHGENAKPFEEFLKWGQVLLNDYEDIDLHLVDAYSIFNYLSEAKAIENWNLGVAPLTPKQQQYLAFYRSLGMLYENFTAKLLSQKKAYKGLAFRYLSGSIADEALIRIWEHYIFAGFNTLAPAEQKIINSLKTIKPVDLLFDADTYYTLDHLQEAGNYLRKFIENNKSGEFRWVENYLYGTQKNITTIGVSGNIGQVKIAGRLLASIPAGEVDQTAVVLNNENLLIPLLTTIPANIKSFNVTMGYPLSLTPIHDLADALLTLHLHARDRLKDQKGGVNENTGTGLNYYFRDLLRVLRHPYITKAGIKHLTTYTDGITSMLLSGKVFFSPDEVMEYFKESSSISAFLTNLLQAWSDTACAITRLEILIDHLRILWPDEGDSSKSSMDAEYIYQFLLIVNKLKQIVVLAGPDLSLKGLHLLMRNISAITRLPFVGEPLTGMQVMGMLETRTLDFRNIIMLSANEGVLPSGKRDNSFITYDIRRDFGLPLHTDKDAVFAYHFYRLLQRADNVHLIYNTMADDLGGGEKSRYLMQIQHELLARNPDITFAEHLHVPSVDTSKKDDVISIAKNEAVMKRIYELAEVGLAPTALSTYVRCPLKFYFSRILNINEETETLDEMDAATFGNAVHEALKELYLPLVGSPLTTSAINEIASNTETTVIQSFGKKYKGGEFSYGKNYLMMRVAFSFIRRFLELEKKKIKQLAEKQQHIVIESLEYLFGKNDATLIRLEQPDGSFLNVKIKGQADRIDHCGTQTRVIDFKTGYVDKSKLTVKEWDSLLIHGNYDKALQLLIYSWLYARQNNKPLPEAGIISFRLLKEGFLKVSLPDDSSDAFAQIETVLTTILEAIFNPKLPFDQTSDPENCKYCPFIEICGR